MTEWDFMIVGDKLKEKQTTLQEAHTVIVDALCGVRDEMTVLKGKWKGSASDEFSASFFQAWERAYSEAEKTGKLIEAFAMAEQMFVSCEAQIGEM